MEAIRQLMAVGLVMALLAAALWWLRRKNFGRPSGRMSPDRRLEMAGRLALGPQHTLCLVRVGGRGILLGLSPAGCQVVATDAWSAYEPPAAVTGPLP